MNENILARSRFSRDTNSPIQALTKTDLAYLSIRQKILEGEFPPGTSVDQEALAAELGLSTTPVREALRRLEAERLVVGRAHRDTIVAPLSLETLEEVYAIRLCLDPLAARLAAELATPEERDRMRELAGEQSAENEDPVAHLHRNRQLHRAIYASCRNALLIDYLDSLSDLSDRYRLVALKDTFTIKLAQKEHEDIVSAVVESNADLAAQLMLEHTAESLRKIRAAASLQE